MPIKPTKPTLRGVAKIALNCLESVRLEMYPVKYKWKVTLCFSMWAPVSMCEDSSTTFE